MSDKVAMYGLGFGRLPSRRVTRRGGPIVVRIPRGVKAPGEMREEKILFINHPRGTADYKYVRNK